MRFGDTRRGLHPRVTTDTLAAHHFQAPGAGVGEDLLGVYDLTTGPGEGAPDAINAVCGRGRRFDGVNEGFYKVGNAAAQAALVGGDWTVAAWVRLPSTPGSVASVYAYGGPIGAPDVEERNFLFGLRFTGLAPQMLWETGAGTDVSRTATTYRVRLHRWYYIAWRRRITSPTLCDLDLVVNGRLVETFTGVTRATGGTHASSGFQVAALLDSAATSMSFEVACDVCAAHVEKRALSDDELRENVRRALLWERPTRVHLRCQVRDQGGVLQDMSTFRGEDWVTSARVENNAGNPTATARVEFHREIGEHSLAPLRSDSPANLTDLFNPASFEALLDEGREVVISFARVPFGIPRGGVNAIDWQELFRGEIDDVDFSSERVEIVMRDLLGGVLSDTYIEQVVKKVANNPDSASYGSPAGVAVQGELQKILNDNDNSAGNNSVPGLTLRTGSYAPIVLFTRDDPLWFVKEWTQRKEPVLTALRNIAGQVGFDVGYLFDPNPTFQTFRLTLFDPGRGRLDADAAIVAGDDAFSPSRLAKTRVRQRTVVSVTFPSSTLTNHQGDRLMQTVTAVDARLGVNPRIRRRFMEVQESSTSQIDTSTEASRMAGAMLDDLKDDELDAAFDLGLRPEIEVYDVIDLVGNEREYTGTQKVSVLSFAHSFADRPSTTVQLRGKPSLTAKRWLQLETRPGQSKAPIDNPGDGRSEVLNGFQLPSALTVFGRTDLGAGGRYLAVKNSRFATTSRGPNFPPDGWQIANGVWNTAFRFETTVTNAGGRSIAVLTAPGAPPTQSLFSDQIPVPGSNDLPIVLEASVAKSGGVGVSGSVDVVLRTFDKNRVANGGVFTFTVINTGDAANTFALFRSRPFFPPVVPPNAPTHFVTVSIQPAAGATLPVYVDEVNAIQLSRESLATIFTGGTRVQTNTDALLPVAANAWQTARLDRDNAPIPAIPQEEDHDYGNNFDPTTPEFSFTAKESGLHVIVGKVTGFVRRPLSTTGLMLDAVNARITRRPSGGASYSPFITGDASFFLETQIIGTDHYLLARAAVGAEVRLERGDSVRLQGFLDDPVFPGVGGAGHGFLGGTPNPFTGQYETGLFVKLKQAE